MIRHVHEHTAAVPLLTLQEVDLFSLECSAILAFHSGYICVIAQLISTRYITVQLWFPIVQL